MNKFLLRTSRLLLTAFLLIFTFFGNANLNAQDAEAGEKLFKSNCASCHHPSKKVVGPALKGAQARWAEKSSAENLYEWVRNSQEVIKSGDAYAVSLFEEYGKSVMTAMPQLKNEDIDNIFAYVESYTDPTPVAAAGNEVAGESEAKSESTPIYIWAIIIVGLIMLVSVVRAINRNLSKTIAEKNGEEGPKDNNLLDGIKDWIAHNRTWTAIIVLILVVLGVQDIGASLFEVGVYTGYQPEQPIKFSHQIHAGQNAIDCNYCHSSARHSKHAGIPSANVCMNCHKAISEGPSGTEEIQKIYDAVGWDAEKGAYIEGYIEKPIQWVKVHNLPDHVYFNHSQHVTVGKVACEKCHGEVKELTVGKQNEPLTMGWCVNCHRETKVQMEGSEYYDEIHSRLTDNLKEQYMKDGTITVSELGGIECSKCHY